MVQSIRVLFLVGNLGRGGAEKQLVSLLDHVDPQQVRARLLSLSHERDEFWEPHLRSGPVDYHCLPADHSQLARLTAVWRHIASFRPHLVWGWHFFTNVYALLPLLFHRRVKLVASLRNDASYLKQVHAWSPWIIKWADAVVANTQAVFDQLVDAGTVVKHALVLPNSVSPAQPASPADTVARIGYCGNIHPRKGLDVFIRAAALLVDQGMQASFVLAGKGDINPYKSQVEELGLTRYFEFVGEVNCAEFVGGLDLFVLPSRHEGCPNVLLEAMARGIPCVATRVGGVPEVIEDGKNGLIVPAENPHALAKTISSIVEDGPARHRMASAGLQSMRDGREPARVAQVILPQILRAIVAGK